MLLALARSAAAPVAAVRETSVVILTIMSAIWLHETVRRRQWLAVTVIVVGPCPLPRPGVTLHAANAPGPAASKLEQLAGNPEAG